VLPILNQVILDVFLELYPDYDRFYDSISVIFLAGPIVFSICTAGLSMSLEGVAPHFLVA
jgi:hypothetical protein